MKTVLKSMLAAALIFSASSALADTLVIERSFANADGTVSINVWIPVTSNLIGPISSDLMRKQALQLAKKRACGEAYANASLSISGETFIYNRTDLSTTGILKYHQVRVACQYGLDVLQVKTFDVSK